MIGVFVAEGDETAGEEVLGTTVVVTVVRLSELVTGPTTTALDGIAELELSIVIV